MSNWYPPPSRPRAVEGGLKARSARGAISQTWWSGRFVEVLEDIGLGNRLQRGRSYARKGQVISLDVAAGMVTAKVQGSRDRPYRVRIGITAFGKHEWTGLQPETESEHDPAWGGRSGRLSVERRRDDSAEALRVHGVCHVSTARQGQPPDGRDPGW